MCVSEGDVVVAVVGSGFGLVIDIATRRANGLDREGKSSIERVLISDDPVTKIRSRSMSAILLNQTFLVGKPYWPVW